MPTEATGGRQSNMVGSAARPLRTDARRNRERVIRAAIELFAQHGLVTTVEQVADRAGVGKATVYRSFPNRDALMSAVAVYQYAEVKTFAEEAIRDDQAPVEAFVRLMFRIFDYHRTNGLYLEVVRRGQSSPEVLEAQQQTRIPLALAMDRCRPHGVIRADIHADDLFFLMGAFSIRLSLDNPPASQWRRAAFLLLSTVGFPAGTVHDPTATE